MNISISRLFFWFLFHYDYFTFRLFSIFDEILIISIISYAIFDSWFWLFSFRYISFFLLHSMIFSCHFRLFIFIDYFMTLIFSSMIFIFRLYHFLSTFSPCFTIHLIFFIFVYFVFATFLRFFILLLFIIFFISFLLNFFAYYFLRFSLSMITLHFIFSIFSFSLFSSIISICFDCGWFRHFLPFHFRLRFDFASYYIIFHSDILMPFSLLILITIFSFFDYWYFCHFSHYFISIILHFRWCHLISPWFSSPISLSIFSYFDFFACRRRCFRFSSRFDFDWSFLFRLFIDLLTLRFSFRFRFFDFDRRWFSFDFIFSP